MAKTLSTNAIRTKRAAQRAAKAARTQNTCDSIPVVAASIPPKRDVPPPLPTRPVGRPSKTKSKGRPPKAKDTPTTLSSRSTRRNPGVPSAPTRPQPSRPRNPVTPTTRRLTRSISRPSRTPHVTERQYYVAVPSSPTRRGPKWKWGNQRHYYERRLKMLKTSQVLYKRYWHASLAEASILRSPPDVDSRSRMHNASINDPDITSMQQLVHSFIKDNPTHPLLESLFGIASQNDGKVNIDTKMESYDKLKSSLATIVNHHLQASDDFEQASTLSTLLFNSGLFSDSSVDKVADKIAKEVNSYRFNAIALLQCIDCHAASLNDSAVSQYASIGNPRPGEALLVKRWQLTEVRSFINRYIEVLLQVKYDHSTAHGEYIHLDYESLVRFLVDQYGLTDKAVREGILIAITGDGAALTTSTRKAGQTCVGIKMIDKDGCNPITKELCFILYDTDDNGEESTSFANAQSADHCYPVAIVLSPESRSLVTGHFANFWSFFHQLSINGLQARGHEPAFKPFEVISPADLSFQQKTTGCGGACKAKKFFCHCCESNSFDTHNLFYRNEDPEEFCEYCTSNELSSCCHRQINDDTELKRKELWLVELLLKDNRLRQSNPSLSLRDCLPSGEVSCFDGYVIKKDKRSEKMTSINLRDSIDANNVMHRHVNDYMQNVFHSVELIQHNPRIRYDPHAADKMEDMTNIEYALGNDGDKNMQFRINLMIDIGQHGLAVNANETTEQLRAKLLKQLQLRFRICRYKDALYCHQRAMANNRVMCPSKSPLCILHFHQRTIEKIVSELISR